jgi:N-methylhydantoinase A/oxoprolinase/acetone carboxylase beta subunit
MRSYLSPKLLAYIRTFSEGFDDNFKNVQVSGGRKPTGGPGLSLTLEFSIKSLVCVVQVLFMQSDGGLTSVNEFSGHKAILSGPAGAWRPLVWTETSCTVEHALCPAPFACVPRGSPWLRPHHLP